MPTYKEKQENLEERDLAMYGFLGYPVLQTADIVIYKARHIPVGIDQMPHLELSREIARRFNHIYKQDIFPDPEGLLTQFPKVTGLDGRKMSKSYDNAIYLSDSAVQVEHKILRTMKTDPARMRRTDKGEPEQSPVYQLHKIYSSPEELAEIAEGCRSAGIGCIDCKKILVRNVQLALNPVWEKRNELISNPDRLYELACLGSKKAAKIAEATMEEVRHAMGLR